MSSLLDDNQPERLEPAPAAAAGPKTKIHAGLIGGVHTELVISIYCDRTFVAVTQVGKLGDIIEVRRDKVQECGPGGAGGEGVGGRAVYSATVLLGRHSEEVELLGRVLAEKLVLVKPLVLCVGIKTIDPGMIRQIVDFIMKHFSY